MTPVLLISLALVPASALLCSAYARAMRRRALGQSIRAVGPASHVTKAGTPTMGGAIVFFVWLGAVGLLSIWQPQTRQTGFVLTAGALFAAIGGADDLISLLRHRSLGLSALWKIGLSSVAVALLFFVFSGVTGVPIQIPFTTSTIALPAVASFALVWIVFLGTTNGMNLADGLDGLAGGLAVLILVGVLVVRPTPENLAICLPLIGALVGLLWINTHPARLFLGDAGSYFLGGVIAALAVSNGLAFILPLLAGVLVLEAISVIAQVGLLRLTGHRLLRMSPIHHHFEAGTGVTHRHILPAPEWPEEQITVRFWILQAFFVGLAVLAARL